MREENTKHAWLCIDPGITTGWALLADDGSVIATSVWGTADLKLSLDVLVRQAHLSGFTLDAVVERMPATGRLGPLAVKLEQVRKEIMDCLVDVYEVPTRLITPGEWKPSRVAKTTDVAKFQGHSIMIHQKDAIRMGRYVIDKESK